VLCTTQRDEVYRRERIIVLGKRAETKRECKGGERFVSNEMWP
jgi:hypothetical protein